MLSTTLIYYHMLHSSFFPCLPVNFHSNSEIWLLPSTIHFINCLIPVNPYNVSKILNHTLWETDFSARVWCYLWVFLPLPLISKLLRSASFPLNSLMKLFHTFVIQFEVFITCFIPSWDPQHLKWHFTVGIH